MNTQLIAIYEYMYKYCIPRFSQIYKWFLKNVSVQLLIWVGPLNNIYIMDMDVLTNIGVAWFLNLILELF